MRPVEENRNFKTVSNRFRWSRRNNIIISFITNQKKSTHFFHLSNTLAFDFIFFPFSFGEFILKLRLSYRVEGEIIPLLPYWDYTCAQRGIDTAGRWYITAYRDYRTLRVGTRWDTRYCVENKYRTRPKGAGFSREPTETLVCSRRTTIGPLAFVAATARISGYYTDGRNLWPSSSSSACSTPRIGQGEKDRVVCAKKKPEREHLQV